jgi:hypothetical protein
VKEQRRSCEALGCPCSVLAPRVFCGVHWKLIPEAARKRIWAAAVGGEDSPEYLAACQAAALALAPPEPNPFPDFQTQVVR